MFYRLELCFLCEVVSVCLYASIHFKVVRNTKFSLSTLTLSHSHLFFSPIRYRFVNVIFHRFFSLCLSVLHQNLSFDIFHMNWLYKWIIHTTEMCVCVCAFGKWFSIIRVCWLNKLCIFFSLLNASLFVTTAILD